MKTPSIRNILVPIDFSRMSIQAIETAKGFAQLFGATVHLAHVHQFYYPAGFTAPMPPVIPYSTYTYDKEAEERAVRELNVLARKHELSPATAHLLTGAPAFDEICKLARELPADLIITPTHGHTGLKHVFLGSTAERIVQHSPCPVLVSHQPKRQAKNGARSSVNSILVPVDFSDCSLRGLNYAIGFAEKCAAKIILLHAVEFGYAYTSDGYAMYDLSELKKAAQKDAERQMAEFVKAAKFGRVPFETAFRTGTPVEEISAFAEGHDVDLIITTTHGLTGFKHVLIGSTAEQVVRHAPCPVLVVPSHPEVRRAQLIRRPTRARRTRQAVRPHMFQRNEMLTRKYRKLGMNPFPERRKTNKFRESHLSK
jgi:nucleotide-binding universal stress UspA family protein